MLKKFSMKIIVNNLTTIQYFGKSLLLNLTNEKLNSDVEMPYYNFFWWCLIAVAIVQLHLELHKLEILASFNGEIQ